MNRVSKTPRAKLIKKLDKLVSEIVRSKGLCERCGKEDTLACAHIFSRRNLRIRWTLSNLLCLCYRCHIHWAHKEPIQFTRWVTTFRDIDELEKILQDNRPMKIFELEEKLEELLKHI